VRVLLTICLLLVLNSCKVKESDLVDNARFEFENTIFDNGLDHLKFQGPILSNQIEDFEPNPEYVIYYWWTKIEIDTLRVYAKVHKELLKPTSIHFSKNYREIYDQLTESHQKDSKAYNLEIDGSKCTEIKKDIAVLLFEDGFEGELIDVFLNGATIFSKKIRTDKMLGFAEDVELGRLSDIKDLSISINNSKKMDIFNNTCSFTFVNLIDYKVYVKYDSVFVPYN
jgi:hypothetical protein